MDRALAEKAAALADAIDAAVAPWLIGAVRRVAAAQRLPGGDRFVLAAEAAAKQAKAEVMPRIRDLLTTDIDAQTTTPLAVLREGTGRRQPSWRSSAPDRSSATSSPYEPSRMTSTPWLRPRSRTSRRSCGTRGSSGGPPKPSSTSAAAEPKASSSRPRGRAGSR